MTAYTRLYANNAKTTLASPIGASDTTIIVSDASKFPVPGVNQFFNITLDTGTTVEIIEVHNVSGNTFFNCVRGVENTSAQAFLTGTRVENRVTAATLTSFARLIDRVADISSVDQLDTPANSPANSYLCASTDDGGNPILAVKSGSKWRFATHSYILTSGTLASNGTVNTMPLASASSTIVIPAAGSHIVQFTTGNNAGYARIIQSAGANSLSWTTPLPYATSTLDQYEIYQSDILSMNLTRNTGSDDALVFAILFGE
jgi:hypothetical protein